MLVLHPPSTFPHFPPPYLSSHQGSLSLRKITNADFPVQVSPKKANILSYCWLWTRAWSLSTQLDNKKTWEMRKWMRFSRGAPTRNSQVQGTFRWPAPVMQSVNGNCDPAVCTGYGELPWKTQGHWTHRWPWAWDRCSGSWWQYRAETWFPVNTVFVLFPPFLTSLLNFLKNKTRSSHCSSAVMNLTNTHEDADSIPGSLSRWRIHRCHELWCRLQTWLGSCIAVAVV